MEKHSQDPGSSTAEDDGKGKSRRMRSKEPDLLPTDNKSKELECRDHPTRSRRPTSPVGWRPEALATDWHADKAVPRRVTHTGKGCAQTMAQTP
eukprot:131079-Amphidinium_carterae.1